MIFSNEAPPERPKEKREATLAGRRRSNFMGSDCTVLTALSGLNGLLSPEQEPLDNHLAPVHPSANPGYAEVDLPPVNFKRRSVSKESASSKDMSEKTWHVLLMLERTLRQRSLEEVADTLMEVLEIDEVEADVMVRNERASSKIVVVLRSPNFSEASSISDTLREQGLCTQVTSSKESGASRAGSKCTIPTLSSEETTPRCSFYKQRASISASSSDIPGMSQMDAVFQKAGGERSSSKKRCSNVTIQTLLPTITPMSSYSEESRIQDIEVNPVSAVHALFARENNMEQKGEDGRDSGEGRGSNEPRRPSKPKASLKSIVRAAGSHGRSSSKESPLARRRTNVSNMDPAEMERAAKAMGMWGETLDALDHYRSARDTEARRQACLVAHFLVYGEIYEIHNTSLADAELPMFTTASASRSELCILIPFWQAMRADESGRVELKEFRRCTQRRLRWVFAEKRKGREMEDAHDTLPSWAARHSTEDSGKYISRLCDMVSQEVFGNFFSCMIDSLMKLLWMHTTGEDAADMKAECEAISKEPGVCHVSAPPVIGSVEHQDLCLLFESLDQKKTGKIQIEDLVNAGIIQPHDLAKTRQDWDRSDCGYLDAPAFCGMMCPTGFRATASSLVGTLPCGKSVVFDSSTGGWLAEEAMPRVREGKGYSSRGQDG